MTKLQYVRFGLDCLCAVFFIGTFAFSCKGPSHSLSQFELKDQWIDKCSEEKTIMCKDSFNQASGCYNEVLTTRYERCAKVYNEAHK